MRHVFGSPQSFSSERAHAARPVGTLRCVRADNPRLLKRLRGGRGRPRLRRPRLPDLPGDAELRRELSAGRVFRPCGRDSPTGDVLFRSRNSPVRPPRTCDDPSIA